MRNIIRNLGLAAALGALALGVTSPAQARHRHGDGGDDAAIAIGAGIVGLAIGAAIASDNRRDRYYDSYYHVGPRYREGYYYRDGYRHRHYRKHRHYRGDGYYYRGRDVYRDDRRWRYGW